MNAFSFDSNNRAHVPEQEFMDYIARTAEHGDYTRERRVECQVREKDWRMCECLLYFNSAGCKLALYNRDFNYGEIY